MAVFLDNLKYMRLYRNQIYLPVKMESRKTGSLIFLFSNNPENAMMLMQHPKTTNINSFISYYIEKNVNIYLNENTRYWTLDESISAKERKEIPESEFGLPDERKYPLDTPEHVRSAIKLFGHCEEDKKHELAVRIMKAAKKFNIEVKEDTEVYKYAHMKSIKEEMLNEAVDYNYTSPSFITPNSGKITEDYITYNVDNQTCRTFFDEDIDSLLETTDMKLRKILYSGRIKNNKEQLLIYEKIKEMCPFIRYAYLTLDKYKAKNMFVDTSHYLKDFTNKNTFKLDIGLNLYAKLLSKLFNDKRYAQNGYTKFTVFIDVDEVYEDESSYNFRKNINILSLIERYLMTHKSLNNILPYDLVFFSKQAYFKVNVSDLDKTKLIKFKMFIKKLKTNDIDDSEYSNKDSEEVLVTKFADKLEKKGISLDNLSNHKNDNISISGIMTPSNHTDTESKKKELVKMAHAAAEKSNTEEEMEKNLDNMNNEYNDDQVIDIIQDLESEDNGVNISKARASRMATLNSKFKQKKINGKSVSDYLNSDKLKEIPKDDIPIDSINEDWKDVHFSKFNETYDLDNDIISIFNSMTDKSAPIAILDIDKEDSITSEDYLETWTVKFEDVDGNRHTIKLDVPKFIDNKFMMLRGNYKTIQGQLMLIPVIKTAPDTSQIVSNYNKIFIRRYNPANGSKTTRAQSILTKILDKYDGKTFKVSIGDNSLICQKYELPIEYQDLATSYSRIEFKDGSYISFNLDEMKELQNKTSKIKPTTVENEDNLPLYFDAKNGRVQSCRDLNVSSFVLDRIKEQANSNKDEELLTLIDETRPSPKLSYTTASILNTEIPVIIVMAFSEGLQKAMDKAKVNYEYSEKRPPKEDERPFIRFKDGYLIYDDSVQSAILMNGLQYVDTGFYSIKDINEKDMWIDALDSFGGRIKADGLDNFYDLMIDPITKEICELYNLPTDYISILGYASSLLVDTKYNKHTDITGNRYRTNEIIAGYVYKTLATAYGIYQSTRKKNKKSAAFSIKQSAVVDAILKDPTASDLSILNPLLEIEASNAVSFKGLSGMNSERSYSLDKRIYDESMLGVIGTSTGFSANVGITRQATVNSSIANTRGFIKQNKGDKLNTLNMLTATEAMTPFMTTHDDAMRIAMGYIQTSKHQMRVKRSSPNLVTTGMDEAIPYMTSNFFSYKFKGNKGKVLSISDKFIVYEDLESKEKKFVDIEEKTMKNSDGGFYVTLKLKPNVKKGQILKYNDILAYDPTSYSKQVGNPDGNGVSYNNGTMAKIAIMTTDEAFNDSTVITDTLSDSMSSDYLVEKTRYLPKDTNIYHLVQKGMPIQEGEPLMIFQNAFEENDANMLLKSITDDDVEAISDLGRIHVRSKLTGVVQDVKIFRTCELDELSPSLKKIVTSYENKIKKEKTELKKMGVENVDGLLDPDYKLEAQGKLKDCLDGVKVFIYIKCHDNMGVGDKLVFSTALKGVIKTIIPKGKEPYTDFRPNEKVEALLTTAGVNARMVSSIILNGLINKILIETDRKCKENLGIKWKKINKIISYP